MRIVPWFHGTIFRVSKKPSIVKTQVFMIGGSFYCRESCPQRSVTPKYTQNACGARCFDLLRNSTLSSIHIHFGIELLVLTALVTSVSLSKKGFFDRLTWGCKITARENAEDSRNGVLRLFMCVLGAVDNF